MKSLITALALTILALTYSGCVCPQKSEPKWEYKTLWLRGFDLDYPELITAGKDGWELVTVSPCNPGERLFYLKRRIQE
jgi:hypothetical protein